MTAKRRNVDHHDQGEGGGTDRKPDRSKFTSSYPPIILFNTQVIFIINILTGIININNIIFKSLVNNKLALYVKSYNDFQKY